MSASYRLADDVAVEPLVRQWPAWWLTVAPIPSSLHLLHTQLRVLKSYLQSPEMHHSTARNPEAAGALFVEVAPERAEEISRLAQRTAEEDADLLQLGEAFDALQTLLTTEAKGQSLEAYYARIPAPLKGLVELVYDYSNRPFIRVLEPLAYRSRYWKKQRQGFHVAAIRSDEARPFFVSTPRLPTPDSVSWEVPFDDARVDALFRSDVFPVPREELCALLGLAPEDPRAERLLTSRPPTPRTSEEADAVRVRYVGHACVLLEHRGVTVLVDPLVPVRPEGGIPRLSFADLPERIDFALITHAHPDHYALETLLRLRWRIGQLVVPKSTGMLVGDVSLRLLAQAIGFRHVTELEAFDELSLGVGGKITALPFLGEHGDLAHSKTAYGVKLGGRTVVFAADSAVLDPQPYRTVREVLGPVDAVFMNTETEGAPHTFPMDSLFPKRRDRSLEKNRRARGSNAPEGLSLLEILEAKRVYNYAMGLEPWLYTMLGPAASAESVRMRESDTLLEQARARGIQAERLNGPRDFLL